MRNPFFVFLAISLILLNGCGKMGQMKSATPTMSQDEAVDTLMAVPLSESSNALFKGKKGVNVEAFKALLIQLIQSGQIKVPAQFRGATGGTPDLSGITNLVGLLQNGSGLLGLVTGLLGQSGGNGAAATSKLDGLLEIIKAALPIITAIAPQFAPIATAILTIIPVVVNLINLFKKPKSASLPTFFPAFAS